MLARVKKRDAEMTPEMIAQRDKEAKEREAWRKAMDIDMTRTGWNAPKRALDAKDIDFTGQWGATFEKIKARLGEGFLIGLIGGRGPGKTQLGVELMKAHTENRHSALYVTATEFFMTIKRAYRDHSSETELDIIKRFRKPSLLILDETGKRAETDWENRLLFELIDKRYQDMSDTLLISNEAQAQFSEAIGPSLASRMNETGGIMQCNWPSFRK
jgi:DNA replication protein DnaC